MTIKNLSLMYGDVVIQHDLSFTINRGDIFIIMGGTAILIIRNYFKSTTL